VTPPGARHASSTTRSIWPRILRTILVGIAVLAVSSASVVGIAVYRLAHSAGDGSVDIGQPEPPPTALDGAFTVLLVGADNAPGQRGFGVNRDAALNDVNILVHVSADHRSGTVVSLPRDLVVPHPSCTDPRTKQVYSAMSAQPINEAFSRGGLGCVVKTVESVTGIEIPYAAQFTFEGTVKMADAVGGVPVCVTKAIDDRKSGLELKKGVSVVKGRTALAYLRERHLIGDGSDLSRIQSQQAYMSSLLRKMTSANTLANPIALYSLANAAVQNVTLSRSMSTPATMVRMAAALRSMNLSHLVFVQYPTVPYPPNPNKVMPNATLAAKLVDRVRHDRRIALDSHALGTAVRSSGSASSSPKPSASPKPTRTDGATVSGLQGRTAAQQTCSVVSRSR
jgi:LCP family protein required for cell wall assembly